MRSTMIVIANASLARLFSREADTGLLVPQATLVHTESRLPGHALADDRPGREAADAGSGPHGYQPRHDPRRLEHERFARAIATELRRRQTEGEFNHLWLLASSAFLGELRAALDEATQAAVRLESDVDLTSFDLLELERRLRILAAEAVAASHAER